MTTRIVSASLFLSYIYNTMKETYIRFNTSSISNFIPVNKDMTITVYLDYEQAIYDAAVDTLCDIDEMLASQSPTAIRTALEITASVCSNTINIDDSAIVEFEVFVFLLSRTLFNRERAVMILLNANNEMLETHLLMNAIDSSINSNKIEENVCERLRDICESRYFRRCLTAAAVASVNRDASAAAIDTENKYQ